MKLETGDFECTNSKCSEWTTHSYYVAENDKDYNRVRQQLENLGVTASCWGESMVTKQVDCKALVNGQPCTGKVSLILMKRI